MFPAATLRANVVLMALVVGSGCRRLAAVRAAGHQQGSPGRPSSTLIVPSAGFVSIQARLGASN